MTNPLKYDFKTEAPALAILAGAGVLSWYFYAHFPEKVITHWNFYGQADGFSGKAFGAFYMPLILAAMYILFWVLPFFDPKKERYADFASAYFHFRFALLSCMFAVFAVAGFSNLGYKIPMDKTITVIIGLLFMYMGNLMGKIKNNWFVGIKTPWTLSSENVWNKTHRFGGYAFVIFGLMLILIPYLGKTLGLVAFISGLALLVFGTTAYSYLIYRREQKRM